MSRTQIIDDIQSQATAEVDSIQTQQESTLAGRRRALKEKIAGLSDEADAKIKEEEQRVRIRWERFLAQEERRVRLVLQDRVVSSVVDGVQDDLKTLPDSPEYPSLLLDWIIEAAIGLGYGTGENPGKATIRCNPHDRSVIEAEIPEIRKRFLSLTGGSLDFEIDEDSLSSDSIGIILMDETGRTAFSNTLADRFRRNSPEIHRIVMGKIFPGRSE